VVQNILVRYDLPVNGRCHFYYLQEQARSPHFADDTKGNAASMLVLDSNNGYKNKKHYKIKALAI
jgi:hypothetical protein